MRTHIRHLEQCLPYIRHSIKMHYLYNLYRHHQHHYYYAYHCCYYYDYYYYCYDDTAAAAAVTATTILGFVDLKTISKVFSLHSSCAHWGGCNSTGPRYCQVTQDWAAGLMVIRPHLSTRRKTMTLFLTHASYPPHSPPSAVGEPHQEEGWCDQLCSLIKCVCACVCRGRGARRELGWVEVIFSASFCRLIIICPIPLFLFLFIQMLAIIKNTGCFYQINPLWGDWQKHVLSLKKMAKGRKKTKSQGFFG